VTPLEQRRAVMAVAKRRAKRGFTTALRPNEPRGAIVLYTRALRELVDEMRRAALDELLPAADHEPVVIEHRLDAPRRRRPLTAAQRAVIVRIGEAVHRRGGAAANDAAEAVTGHARREAKRTLGIERGIGGRGTEARAQFVRANVRLITSLGEQAKAEVEGIVSEATTGGLRVEALADRIEERFGVLRSRAELIARDQTLTLNGQLAAAAQREAGVTRYRWSSSRDERVREGHAALEGQICSWDDPPVVDEKTGERGHPGEPIQCRCVAIALVEDLLG
jgi:SPP1 gp7 family putative phage head morphogenesis protein